MGNGYDATTSPFFLSGKERVSDKVPFPEFSGHAEEEKAVKKM